MMYNHLSTPQCSPLSSGGSAKRYDLTIIGAGIAGLTAAVYAARAGLDFIVLEQDGWGGGQISSAHAVDNYPGLPGISGADLGEAVRAQAEALGAQIEPGIVQDVVDLGEYKQITLDDGTFLQSRAVIAATGANPRRLMVPGEETLLGCGVSYCAVCDGAFYANRDVIVVGGGDTAVEDAIYLSGICKSVTLVHRRDVFRAAKTRVDLLRELPNVTVRCNERIQEIKGSAHVSSVILEGAEGAAEIQTDAVFIAVGTEPAADYLKKLPLTFADGYAAADETGKTAVPGIFVAGDVRTKQLRQAVTAAADGANAATSAIAYLKE